MLVDLMHSLLIHAEVSSDVNVNRSSLWQKVDPGILFSP